MKYLEKLISLFLLPLLYGADYSGTLLASFCLIFWEERTWQIIVVEFNNLLTFALLH